MNFNKLTSSLSNSISKISTGSNTLKNAVWAAVTGLCLVSAPTPASAGATHIKNINTDVFAKQIPANFAQKHTFQYDPRPNQPGSCNATLIKYNNQVFAITAKHCIDDTIFQTNASHATNDISLLDINIHNPQKYPTLVPKTITTLSKIDLLPKYNTKLQSNEFTRAHIVWCYATSANPQENLCFHISWGIISDSADTKNLDDVLLMSIGTHDAKKVIKTLEQNGFNTSQEHCKYTDNNKQEHIVYDHSHQKLAWLSGAWVFIHNEKTNQLEYIGPLSMSHAINPDITPTDPDFHIAVNFINQDSFKKKFLSQKQQANQNQTLTQNTNTHWTTQTPTLPTCTSDEIKAHEEFLKNSQNKNPSK